MIKNSCMLIKCDILTGSYEDRMARIKNRMDELYLLPFTHDVYIETEACREELYLLRGILQVI